MTWPCRRSRSMTARLERACDVSEETSHRRFHAASCRSKLLHCPAFQECIPFDGSRGACDVPAPAAG
eukprot:5876501-Alexandrium_andersonii.AAC.1